MSASFRQRNDSDGDRTDFAQVVLQAAYKRYAGVTKEERRAETLRQQRIKRLRILNSRQRPDDAPKEWAVETAEGVWHIPYAVPPKPKVLPNSGKVVPAVMEARMQGLERKRAGREARFYLKALYGRIVRAVAGSVAKPKTLEQDQYKFAKVYLNYKKTRKHTKRVLDGASKCNEVDPSVLYHSHAAPDTVVPLLTHFEPH